MIENNASSGYYNRDKCKKVTLVYPPSCPPTRSPIGIALIKSFIEKNSDISVKCLDLNIDFHRFYSKEMSKEDLLDKKKLFSFFHDLYKTKNLEVKHKYFDDLWDVPFLSEMLKKIISTKPDVVGISICFNQQFFYACALAKAIKEKLNIPVIFGGSAMSFAKEKYEKEFGVEVITGAGEEKLLERLMGRKLDGCKNLRPYADYSDFNFNQYYVPKPVIPIQSCRSCYWGKCVFCVHHKTFNKYSQRPISDLIEEIKMHYSNGIKHFAFVDDMISPKRIEEFADRLLAEELKIFYQFETRPTKEFDEKLARKLYNSGCRIILWGVESGNQKTIDIMKKGVQIKDVPQVLKSSFQAGIKNFIFIMYNFPTETEYEFENTIKFLKDNQDYIEFVSRSEFGLMYGSPMSESPEKYGMKDVKIKKRTFLPSVYTFKSDNKINHFGEYARIINEINKLRFHMHYFQDHKLVEYSE